MVKHNIKKAALILALITIIEKMLGFIREIVIARYFGANGLTDAYIGGFLIPNFIMVLLSAGLINIYTPVFISEYEKDKDESWNRINSVSTYIMFFLVLITFLGIIFSKGLVKILYPGFTKENIYIASSISKLFFIGVFLYSITIILGAILNCFREFIYQSISIGLLSIGIIIFVVLFGHNNNINSIAYGYMAGAIIGFIIEYIKLKNINAKIRINFSFYKEFSYKFIKLLFPVIIATSMSQANVFVDRVFASYLSEGSMSYLSYSNRISELPIVLFSGIIATIVFPDMIFYINKGDFINLKAYVNKALVISLILLLPSFFGTAILNNEIVKLLYQGKMFSAQDTINTASALLYYTPTIIMYGLIGVISKIYYSMKDTKTLMYISIISIFLNALFDYILMKPMSFNGLALATSLVSVFQFFSTYFILKRKIDISDHKYLIKNILKILISCTLMSIVIILTKSYFKSFNIIINTSISIIIGIVIYLSGIIILKVDEVNNIIKRLIKKI